jgi:hypothetical protein
MRLEELNKMFENISSFDNLNYILFVSIISFIFAVGLGLTIDFVRNESFNGTSKSSFDDFNFIISTSVISFMLAVVLGSAIIIMKEGAMQSSVFIVIIICFVVSSLVYILKGYRRKKFWYTGKN